MSSTILTQVAKQRQVLKEFLYDSMFDLAQQCARVLHDPAALDDLLSAHMQQSSLCKYIWVLDHSAHQVSATIAHDQCIEEQRGRDRAARPYMQRGMRGDHFYLSDAYISRNRKRPSLTSVQTIVDEDNHAIGFLGADFDLRELPHTATLNFAQEGWRQMKGDPAIRGGLFAQHRAASAMDQRIDDVLDLMNELIVAHGIFHAKLHFSSSRATIWLVDSPYDYQILNIDELTDASVCLAFPKREYFEQAKIPQEQVRTVFDQFKKLRFADETIYLRSASLNIVNEMVGLNFSCDGSHYVRYDEFLAKDNRFWFGVQ